MDAIVEGEGLRAQGESILKELQGDLDSERLRPASQAEERVPSQPRSESDLARRPGKSERPASSELGGARLAEQEVTPPSWAQLALTRSSCDCLFAWISGVAPDAIGWLTRPDFEQQLRVRACPRNP